MNQQIITTEGEFDLLEPIQNHLDNNASLDGCMFETFGAELEFVRKQPDNQIWTYLEEDNKLFYQSGYHHVNRLGYLVTSKPYDGPYTAICVHDYGEEYPVMWSGEGDNDGLIYGIESRTYERYLENGEPDLSSHCEVQNVEWFATAEERDENLG